MLSLRRGRVVAAGDPRVPMQDVEVLLGGTHRRALADVALVGACGSGDDVIVSLAGEDVDLVHANLTRGLRAERELAAGVTKLAHTSLQHPFHPVEAQVPGRAALPDGAPVGVLFLHAQLAPVAWAFRQAAPGARLGFVQTGGGALPGGLSAVVRELRERGLLAGHVCAGPAYGGIDGDAVSTAGALQHGFAAVHWHAALCGPGPGTLGSGTRLGHSGMVALESAHTAAALGCRVVVAPRRSAADPRPRQRGLSHHTRTMLELALTGFVVAGDRAEPGLGRKHEWRPGAADLDGYLASGLPARVLGRTLAEDPEFFVASLAAGSVLAAIMRAT